MGNNVQVLPEILDYIIGGRVPAQFRLKYDALKKNSLQMHKQGQILMKLHITFVLVSSFYEGYSSSICLMKEYIYIGAIL